MTTSPFIIDEDTFFERFEPLPNHLDPNCGFDLGSGGCLFAATGREYAHVREQDPHTVWTLIEADGLLYIDSGIHFVNRLGYIVTRVPVEPHADYSVPLDE